MTPASPAVRNLFRGALIIFVITVVIGILNGTGVWDPPRNVRLTHVHAGTLGWITLSVAGASIWMFANERVGDGRALANFNLVTVSIYVIAFWVGTGIYRPIAGVLAFIAFTWLLVWVVRAVPGGTMTVPKLSLLLSIVSLFIGAVLGVLLGLQIAGTDLVGGEVGDRIGQAHPNTMTIGFVILAGLGITEWLLRSGSARPIRQEKAGVVQVSLFFLAGVVIIVGILGDIEGLAETGGALQVVGLFIFLPRVAKDLAPARWRESIPGLYARLAVVGLVASVALLVLLIAEFTSGKPFPEFVHVLLAYDHNNFILVMTNIILGMMAASVVVPDRVNRWIIAGVNIGAVGFIVGLLAQSDVLKRIFTPILGVALLWAIWTYVRAAPATERAGVETR
jgi:hypothetical protein